MHFLVKAIQPDFNVVTKTFEAADESTARAEVRSTGLQLIWIRRRHTMLRPPSLKRGSRFPLLLFSQELSILIDAGLPIVEAIDSLREKESNASTRQVLNQVVHALYDGKALSQALSEFPSIFPELYIALIGASERTGSIADALKRYVSYQTRLNLIRSKVVGASIYPALLLLVGGFVLIFLLGYVVPRFSLVFADMGRDLPFLSRLLIGLGELIHQHYDFALGVAVLGIASAWTCISLKKTRQSLFAMLRKFSWVSNRIAIYQLSRLYRSIGILLQGGIPIVTALGMVRGLLDEDKQRHLDSSIASIKAGRSLSSALEDAGLVTPVATRMLRAGERSGELATMVVRIAEFHDEENDRWVEWFTRLFEPLLMVIVGGAIGLVVVLMYVPIFELASSIQ